jgi:predicted dehydrogenase
MSEETKSNTMDRRRFIRTGAAAGASLVMAPMIMKHARANNSNDLNIALIGYGAEGQVLTNAILKLNQKPEEPKVTFRAVCDIWESYHLRRGVRMLQAYKHPVNGYVDYREMLAKEKNNLDAVIVASPDFWHARHTIDSLNEGLHVYCEKEMSNDLTEAKEIVLAAERTGKLLQIGHQRRSNPRYRHCYNKLIKDAELLGKLTAVRGQWNRSVQPDLTFPPKYEIPINILRKYGFSSMNQFRNWRWYKKLGGGPMVDLGSHQIDIFSWFLEANPVSVVASGGTDYYDKSTHEWYDTVMAIYEYNTRYGKVRAFYQTLTTNSSEGYFENFMGDLGTLQISESGGRGGAYREQSAPVWDKWVSMGYLIAPQEEETKQDVKAVLDVRETVAPPKFDIPVQLDDPYHLPHLKNFFDSIRAIDTLNCPGEIGYETAVTVLKVNEAVEANRRLVFRPDEFSI